LAEALAVVHAAGFVHQDISPQNILLAMGRIDRPVIVDFGAALDVQRGATASPGVRFVGKFSFASPEQIRGETITSACDIYSLALTLAAARLGRKIAMGHDYDSAVLARLAEPDLTSVEKTSQLTPLPLGKRADTALMPMYEQSAPLVGNGSNHSASRYFPPSVALIDGPPEGRLHDREASGRVGCTAARDRRDVSSGTARP
jgi:serine/threonine protein kinase